MKFTDQYFTGAQTAIMGVLADARDELMANYGRVKFSLKSDNSVVTKLDKELEIKLRDSLRKFDSNVGLMGEEHPPEGSDKDYWLLDPIDGTESFIRGLPASRNIATFVSNNEPIYALVYRYPTDDLFVALKGKGTTKNGQKILVNEAPLKRAWLEFSVKMTMPEGYKIYQKLRPEVAGITVHHDFLEVVEGKLEGIIVYKSAGDIWDYAPRALLIKEAGGQVTNIGKDKYTLGNNDILATNNVIFEQVQQLIGEALEQ